MLTEADRAAIAAKFQQGGAFAAGAELQRRFRGLSASQAIRWARVIAGMATSEAPGGGPHVRLVPPS